jgi:hypothetical protein
LDSGLFEKLVSAGNVRLKIILIWYPKSSHCVESDICMRASSLKDDPKWRSRFSLQAVAKTRQREKKWKKK